MATYYMRADGSAGRETLTWAEGTGGNAGKYQITTGTNHDWTTGDQIGISGATGTGVNGNWTVTVIDANEAVLDGSTYAAGASGGNAIRTDAALSAAGTMSVATHNSMTFSADDIILLSSQGEDYTAQITCPSSGTAGHPIVYKNVAGEYPTFDLSLSVANTGWSDEGGGIYSKSYTKTYSGNTVDLFFQDGILKGKASSAAISSGNWYWNNGTSTLYFKPPTGHTPDEYTLSLVETDTYSVFNGINLNNKSYITISSNTSGRIEFTKCENGIRGYIYNTPANILGITVSGCYFKYCYDGVRINIDGDGYSSTGTVTNCTAEYCNAFVRIYSKDTHTTQHTWTISNNYGNGIGTCDGTVYFNASATDNEYVGLQNPLNCQVNGNTAINGRHKFLMVHVNASSASSGNRFYSNSCFNNLNGYGCRWESVEGQTSDFTDNMVYNNIFYLNTGYSGLLIQSNTASTGVNKFYNNTVYGAQYGVQMWTFAGTNDFDWEIKNNIFSGITTYNIRKEDTNDTITAIDYNCYTPTVGFQIYPNNKTFSQWKSDTSQDANSIEQTASIINAGGTTAADYKLQSTSPAKTTGTNLYSSGITTDYFGNPRPKTGSATKWSIGANQWKGKVGGVDQPAKIGGTTNYEPGLGK